MNEKYENGALGEKPGNEGTADAYTNVDPEVGPGAGSNELHRDLKGRHMQMIAM